MSGAVGGGRSPPSRAALAGTSPLATLQVLCAYSDPADPTTMEVASSKDLPAILSVRGLPLEHCALGVPLQLRYLVRLRDRTPGPLSSAPHDVVVSIPIVGERRGAAEQAGGALKESFCLVDTPRRKS
jgi:hypothetical protein